MPNMNLQFLRPLSVIVVALLAAGCASTVRDVDPNGQNSIKTLGIDQKDYLAVAERLANELRDFVNAGKLETPPTRPALLAISRITNQTGQQFDTDLLVKKIRMALLQTGRVVTMTTVSYGGTVEDPLAEENVKLKEFRNNNQATSPDYTLSGKIIELRAKQGSTRQSTYVFQLSLSNSSGLAVWEGEASIGKQGKNSNIGW